MENSINILIVDDEIDITELLSSFLKSKGFNCDVVYNGKDAIDRIKTKKFDVVLLDVMLPYIDGYHVAYEITSEMENPPAIIIITSRDTQHEKNIAKMSGAVDVIQKPFELDKILEVIKKVVERREK
jgi:DNA-binding response OmpR family regulator